VSSEKTLNEVFSACSSRRRYEVWFLRLALKDGSGAWWFRYLLMNPGRLPSANVPERMPVQVWATWFPAEGHPITVIQGFSLADLDLSSRQSSPFHFLCGKNEITENRCRGTLDGTGHHVSWELHYRSSFHVTLSDKGWIGFSRTPHSNAVFSGRITIDGLTVEGNPLGCGLQGHNCGYKHRDFWVWSHAHFCRRNGATSILEALVYDMPMGLVFRKAVLWHNGRSHVFRKVKEKVRDRDHLRWQFSATSSEGVRLDFSVDGHGPGIHKLPYERTDCCGTFQVLNNSLASARCSVRLPGENWEELETSHGAVLEMAGNVESISDG
jgi:hypothetical protein